MALWHRLNVQTVPNVTILCKMEPMYTFTSYIFNIDGYSTNFSNRSSTIIITKCFSSYNVSDLLCAERNFLAINKR